MAAVRAAPPPTRALYEAENVLEDRMIRMKEELARIEALPRALAEMVKPAERIESIRIHNVTGLGGGGGLGAASGGEGKTPVNQALDSILGMAVQLPALKTLGEELGLSMGGAVKTLKKDSDSQD
jgi:uncharacterized membrane protein YqiK